MDGGSGYKDESRNTGGGHRGGFPYFDTYDTDTDLRDREGGDRPEVEIQTSRRLSLVGSESHRSRPARPKCRLEKR